MSIYTLLEYFYFSYIYTVLNRFVDINSPKLLSFLFLMFALNNNGYIQHNQRSHYGSYLLHQTGK